MVQQRLLRSLCCLAPSGRFLPYRYRRSALLLHLVLRLLLDCCCSLFPTFPHKGGLHLTPCRVFAVSRDQTSRDGVFSARADGKSTAAAQISSLHRLNLALKRKAEHP